MIRAVIFDLFDTLVRLPRDKNPYYQLGQAIRQPLLIRQSLVVDAPTLESFCDRFGATYPANLADIQRDLDIDIEHCEVFDDAIVTLRLLQDKGLSIALISNLASPYKRVVKRLGLEQYFDAVIYSCDIGIAKPDPPIYLAALEELGTTADSTLMVGDNQHADVDGPENCGIRGFLIDRTGKRVGASVLNRLDEISSFLG